MQQRIAPDADVDEGAVGKDARDGAFHHFADLQVADRALARFDHGEADAVAIAIQLLNPEGDLLPFFEQIRHLRYACGRQFGNVHQAVTSDADIHEGAKLGDALDRTLQRLPDAEQFDDWPTLASGLSG